MRLHMFGGRLILIVGPSGAGKDSLIAYAKQRLESDDRVRFVKRVITRPPSVGEDHQPVDGDQFERLIREEAFALHWQAHGLSYGLPIVVDTWLGEGRVVVANGSRAMLSEAARRFPALQILNVTASPEVIQKRLRTRGREDEASRKARIERNTRFEVGLAQATEIDNSGDLASAGNLLVATILNGLPNVA